MWQLRLIIILIGLVFIALVYLLSRQRKGKRAAAQREEPTLGGSEALRVPTDLVASSEPPQAGASLDPEAAPQRSARATAAPPCKQLIVVLHVIAHGFAEFDGAAVLTALRASGLQYGRMRVFHRLAARDPERSVFSVASMVEPGELQPETLGHQQLAGLTLFLVLPGPEDAVAACADMIATARALAAQLRGEVQNEGRTPFTAEDAQKIRQRVLEFQTAA